MSGCQGASSGAQGGGLGTVAAGAQGSTGGKGGLVAWGLEHIRIYIYIYMQKNGKMLLWPRMLQQNTLCVCAFVTGTTFGANRTPFWICIMLLVKSEQKPSAFELVWQLHAKNIVCLVETMKNKWRKIIHKAQKPSHQKTKTLRENFRLSTKQLRITKKQHNEKACFAKPKLVLIGSLVFQYLWRHVSFCLSCFGQV